MSNTSTWVKEYSAALQWDINGSNLNIPFKHDFNYPLMKENVFVLCYRINSPFGYVHDLKKVCHCGNSRAKYRSTPDDSVVVAHQMVAAVEEEEEEEEEH